ncbi:hypothetical protein [Brevibacillus borstelensis]|uniref:hypothetical protein n=1 Tax=Brevibacillus borstelensis TaxID=45462 RepID=UPI0030BFC8C6
MKGKGILATGVLALLVAINGQAYTDASSNKFVAETKEEKEWQNYVRKSIDDKIFETYKDSLESFDINQDDYTYHSMHAIPSEQEGIDQKTVRSLKKVIFETAMKDVKTGDFQPGIFIKNDGSEALFTFKSGDSGENHIYWFKPDANGKWKLVNSAEKKGKKVEKLKLKKLNEFVEEYRAKNND